MKLTKEMAEKIFSAKDLDEAKRIAAELGCELSELSDEELDRVAGGVYPGEIYQEKLWRPRGEQNLKYLCPWCGFLLEYDVPRYGFPRYYCLTCDVYWDLDDKRLRTR